MKRLFSLLIIICLLLNLITYVFSEDNTQSETKYIYVDPSAPEGGYGSESNPFRTVEEARDMLRERLSKLDMPSGGICVVLAEGEYRFSDTFVFTNEDSGKDGKFVTYRGNGNVSFSVGEVGTVHSGSIVSVEDGEFLAFENIDFKENLNASLLSLSGSNIKIKNCTFSASAFTKTSQNHSEHFAVFGKGSNISIESSEFFNVEGGVMLVGDDIIASVTKNTIHNCYFHDLSLSNFLSVPAISIIGNGDEISHCEIDSTASSGIVFEGISHLISSNVIKNTAIDDSFGAICSSGGFTTYGNKIENNFVDGCEGIGVSLPNGASGSIVRGNVIKDSPLGIYLGGGRNTEITSNMILGINNKNSRGILYDSSFREEILKSANKDTALLQIADKEFLTVISALSERYSELREVKFSSDGEIIDDFDDPSWYFNPTDSDISSNAFYISRESDTMSVELIGESANGIGYQTLHGRIYSNVMMPRGDFSDFPKMKWNNYELSEDAAVFKVLKDFKSIPFESIGRLGLEPVMYFTDVNESDWFYSSVSYAFSYSLMSGTNRDGTIFSPYTVTTRAMLVQMLYNLEGMPEVTYSDAFEDVSETDWYAPAVMWAYENGITTGTGDGRFDPGASVTREQIAVFLYRFISEYKGEAQDVNGTLDGFGDKDEVSPYTGFAEAVTWAVENGIISGKNEFGVIRLAPRDVAQRCETAAIIARFHEGFVK